MNKKHFIALLALSALLFSCRSITGSGNIVTEKRDLSGFTGVRTEGIISAEVKQGPSFSVQVEGDDNLVRYVRTRVKGNMLEIDLKFRGNIRFSQLKVYVTAPVISQLQATGVGSIYTKSIITNSDRIVLRTSGVGGITADVDAPNVEAKASGVGSIKLSGRTRNYQAQTSGTGSINSFELLAEKADAKVSGVGSIRIHASMALKARVSGVGSINYRGNPSLDAQKSGVGSINKDAGSEN